MAVTYRCSNCKQIRSKETLFKKTVEFTKLGETAIIKSVVTEWLCYDCLPSDPDWNAKPYGSPGHVSEAKERAEALKKKIFQSGIE